MTTPEVANVLSSVDDAADDIITFLREFLAFKTEVQDPEAAHYLDEADRCTKPGQLGLILRREGLYSSHISVWRRWRRRACPEHPESQKPPTESQRKHELARLQRENTRLQLKLEHAEKLLSLQKKLADMMEAIEPTDGNEGSSA